MIVLDDTLYKNRYINYLFAIFIERNDGLTYKLSEKHVEKNLLVFFVLHVVSLQIKIRKSTTKIYVNLWRLIKNQLTLLWYDNLCRHGWVLSILIIEVILRY